MYGGRWRAGRLFAANAPTAAIFDRLGIEVAKVEMEPLDPVRGLSRFLEGHPSESDGAGDARPRRPAALGSAVDRRSNGAPHAYADPFRPGPHAWLRRSKRQVRSISSGSSSRSIIIRLQWPASGAIQQFCRALWAWSLEFASYISARMPRSLPSISAVASRAAASAGRGACRQRRRGHPAKPPRK